MKLILGHIAVVCITLIRSVATSDCVNDGPSSTVVHSGPITLAYTDGTHRKEWRDMGPSLDSCPGGKHVKMEFEQDVIEHESKPVTITQNRKWEGECPEDCPPIVTESTVTIDRELWVPTGEWDCFSPLILV